MIRDFDLMRVICLRLRDADRPLEAGMLTAQIHEPPATVEHQLALMLELKLVKEVIPDDDGDELCLRLTNLGHDFLALSHYQPDWVYALEATDHLGGTTFKVLTYCLSEAHNRRIADAFAGLQDNRGSSSRTAASA